MDPETAFKYPTYRDVNSSIGYLRIPSLSMNEIDRLRMNLNVPKSAADKKLLIIDIHSYNRPCIQGFHFKNFESAKIFVMQIFANFEMKIWFTKLGFAFPFRNGQGKRLWIYFELSRVSKEIIMPESNTIPKVALPNTVASISQELSELGVKAGMTVLVHTSLFSQLPQKPLIRR
jgi:hypothetical protein